MHWSGKDGKKIETRIDMVPCTKLEPMGLLLLSEYSKSRGGQTSYLCPDTQA